MCIAIAAVGTIVEWFNDAHAGNPLLPVDPEVGPPAKVRIGVELGRASGVVTAVVVKLAHKLTSPAASRPMMILTCPFKAELPSNVSTGDDLPPDPSVLT